MDERTLQLILVAVIALLQQLNHEMKRKNAPGRAGTTKRTLQEPRQRAIPKRPRS